MDNLESHTYEVFEKDPVKYSEYQKAIFCALHDRVAESELTTRVTYVICRLSHCVTSDINSHVFTAVSHSIS